MGQSIKTAFRIALGVTVMLVAGACSVSPTGPSRHTGAGTARLNSSTVQPDPTSTQGVFIGGGAAAPVDTTGSSRGVFIGGGM